MTEAHPPIDQIFADALQRTAGEERAGYLDTACGANIELRQRVERLLEAHAEAENFLESPATEVATSVERLREQPSSEVALDFLTNADKSASASRLGHYKILEVVGSGGMGIVLKALDEKLHRVVAIKALAPALAASAMARKRFVREAQAAAAVRHDNVVDIYAVEEDGAVPYLVMEFVDGVSLEEKLRRHGPLQVKEALRIGMQMAEGLAAAHQEGLVHRDVKPANILLENGVERVKITDFGLARAVDDVGVTKTGDVAGTPQYMSPEQAQGQTVDPRSDLFSLGSVLYAMCTGRAPFRADSAVAILRRVCDDTPRPIREINSEIPEWLILIIDRLLAKKPNE